jgi:hypothetical protein
MKNQEKCFEYSDLVWNYMEKYQLENIDVVEFTFKVIT